MTRLWKLIPLALLALASACDNESLAPPATRAGLVDTLFARYVAFGNSITAGVQSGGINDSTQRQSYAVLLAAQMGTEFNVPLLNRPGCPPPFTNVFAQSRLGPPVLGGCALRNPLIPRYLHNVAFPGAEILEAYDYFDPSIVPSETDAYKTLLLGGHTALEMARRVQPTFVTVWLGANDALGAVLDRADPGNPARVNSPATFAKQYATFLDSLDALKTIQGGVLIGVPQVALAPYLTQGRVWKSFETVVFDPATAPFNALDVDVNCLANQPLSAGDTAWVSVPFEVGAPKLALAQARVDSVAAGQLVPQNLQTVVIDCGVDAEVVTVAEMVNLFQSVAAFNAAIEAEAAARNWAYVDLNPLLLQLVQDAVQIRPFPAFNPSDPQHASAPFGAALSLDGIHPSAATHRLVAAALIQIINTTYGTSILALN